MLCHTSFSQAARLGAPISSALFALVLFECPWPLLEPNSRKKGAPVLLRDIKGLLIDLVESSTRDSLKDCLGLKP